ncbi:MAG: undecaprenyl-diphosphate phosphatase [Candidatus Lightella neohaematopini]|nr:undecaprenyl-diphosphate phosphatase [Candidatus Lightella neohaematopini]
MKINYLFFEIDYKEYIKIIILGIVEGITEFLPVSSTGHMILVSDLLNFNSNKIKIFDIVIQFSSVIVIIILFKTKLLKIIKHTINTSNNENINFFISHIIICLIPIGILGLFFHRKLEQLNNVNNIILSLLCGSITLTISELLKPNKLIKHINYLQAFIIGCIQCLSLYPGFSRLGATIFSGSLLKIHRCVIIEFSFIMSIPLMCSTSIISIIDNIKLLKLSDIPILITGMLTTFIILMIISKKCLLFIKNKSLKLIIIYRLIITTTMYFYFKFN